MIPKNKVSTKETKIGIIMYFLIYFMLIFILLKKTLMLLDDFALWIEVVCEDGKIFSLATYKLLSYISNDIDID